MTSLDDKTLQRLHDGDLSPEETRRAESQLATNPEAGRRLEALSQLQCLLRGAVSQDADQADLVEVWDRVKADLGKQARPGAWERVRLWLGESMGTHPFRWVAAGAAMTVLAVAVTLFAMTRPEDTKGAKTAVEAARNQLEIEALDFKGRHPDIFQIREGERSTTVIWVHPDDEDEEPEDRPAPPGGPEDI
ncbi:MAG: hypothetical protein RBU30_01470 [Polyangia bacterium]|jgi:anti-sigma factor RsiW|nr:hypothetical protein [Polyangia bacterium]